MTDGTLWALAAEWTSALCISSACATPFRRSTIARRTAVTLIGSYVAFNTSTGSCINDARRGNAGLWNLLSAGESSEGTTDLAASEAANRREYTPSLRVALIALTSVQLFLLLTFCGFRIARAKVNPSTCPRFAQRLRTRMKRRASRLYIIY